MFIAEQEEKMTPIEKYKPGLVLESRRWPALYLVLKHEDAGGQYVRLVPIAGDENCKFNLQGIETVGEYLDAEFKILGHFKDLFIYRSDITESLYERFD